MVQLKTLAIIPLFAIASCSQNTEVKNQEIPPVSNNSSSIESSDSKAVIMSGENLNENISSSEINSSGTELDNSSTVSMSGEDLNENISPNLSVENKAFDEKYNLPNGVEVSLKGSLEVTEGKITNVSFDNPQGTQIKFAEGIPSQIIGKDLKGLKVDYVSGASLSTEAFNNFIDKVN